jgi:NADPH:quinone reductase-like Zn-dependent oxidoreductase
MYNVEAWVLHAGDKSSPGPGELLREQISFSEITDEEALVEPLYGSWEGNMTHAIRRQPIDVCLQRKEPRVVLGNAGLVRVLRPGRAVTHLKEGDVCLFFGTGRYDAFGYMELAHAYDTPGSVGLLAKKTKIQAKNLFPIPKDTRFSLEQWAAFTIRYLTAWSNWRVALGALRLQLSEEDLPKPFVWGWGGGTTLAELDLAKRAGCAAVLITGSDARGREAEALGIETLDRRQFPELNFDEERYAADAAYRGAYQRSERAFLEVVEARTGGLGVSIFLDYIGTPVLRVSLKALGRQGVLATAGWKCGVREPLIRSMECIKRHSLIHTHYARWSEVPEAMRYAEAHGWMPAVRVVAPWDEVPALARDYDAGKIESYFPLYLVNAP